MRGAANWILRVVVKIGERRKLVAALLVRNWVGENLVFRQFGQSNVSRHVVEIGAVVLTHEDELAAVAEDSGADAASF